MDGKLLALTSAFFFGIGPVVLSLGFQKASSDLAVLTTYVFGLPMLVLLSPFLGGFQLDGLSLGTLLLFATGGLLGPLLGRTLLYNGIERLGSSRAFTIKNAAPLVTATLATLVLSEPVVLRRWLAIVVIVIGLAIIGKRSSIAPGPLPRRVSGLILAVLSAISFGLQPVVMKLGLQESAEPLSASVIGTAAALLGFLLYLLFSGRLRSLQFDRRSLGFFGFVGVAHTLGFLTINFAVNADDVTLVYPISATAPLFTFVMSYFLLKNVERLTLWDLVGMLAIMAGVVVLFK